MLKTIKACENESSHSTGVERIQQEHTLSGHIGKVVASHAAVTRSIPLRCSDLYYARGAVHEGGRCDQSIGSTVSDAIVRSWLWLTATRSSPVGCFSALLKVVDN